jgi:hypothetical protein
MAGRFNLDDTTQGPVRLVGMDTRRAARTEGAATLIQNFNVGIDGLLRGIVGPAPVMVDLQTGAPVTYMALYGVFLGNLGGLETLLIYEAGAIKRWTPWSGQNAWRTLEEGLQAGSTLAPAQFLPAGQGVVILPQSVNGAQPRYYDGMDYGYLGYPDVPPTLEPIGPSNRGQSNVSYPAYEGHNAAGVARMSADLNRTYENDGSITVTRYRFYRYGFGAIGTTEANPASNDAEGADAGVLLPGEWSASVQYINRWGHISAPSPLSAPQRLSFRRPINTNTQLEDLRQNWYWNVPVGPKNTVGRIISRTRDTINNGAGFATYELRGSAGSSGLSSFATVPDNASTLFYDSFGDGSLLTETMRTIQVPSATSMAFAFGRLWLGTRDGRIYFSKQGNIGTFLRDEFVVASGRVTGFALTPDGLIAFTAVDAMMVIERPEAAAFTTRRMASMEGCVAPDSIRTLPDGTVLWLSNRGFCAYAATTDGGAPVHIGAPVVADWTEHMETVRTACAAVHPTQGTYICWVQTKKGKIGFQFDAAFGWSIRTDVEATSATPFDDTIIVTGVRNADTVRGIWCLDRRQYKSAKVDYVGDLTYVIETEHYNTQSQSAVSPWHIEMEVWHNTAPSFTVECLPNGRAVTTSTTHTVDALTPDNGSDNGRWDSFVWGAEGEYWDKDLQSVIKADVSAHHSRSFRLRITTSTPPTIGWISVNTNKQGGVR